MYWQIKSITFNIYADFFWKQKNVRNEVSWERKSGLEIGSF